MEHMKNAIDLKVPCKQNNSLLKYYLLLKAYYDTTCRHFMAQATTLLTFQVDF